MELSLLSFKPFECPVFDHEGAYDLLSGKYGYGWFAISSDKPPQKIDIFTFPKVCVYDTETWVKNGAVPVLATLIDVVNNRLYVWVSSLMTHHWGVDRTNLLAFCVPGNTQEGLTVFAHNASYDMVRTRIAYTNLEVDWYDTQSMFTAVRGLSNQQVSTPKSEYFDFAWEGEGAGGSLSDLTQFYLGAGEAITPTEKKLRKIFVNMETPSELLTDPAAILNYSVKDVYSLYLALGHLVPEWLDSLPHPDSRKSHTELMRSRLPVEVSQWNAWVDTLKARYNRHVQRIEEFLTELRDVAIATGPTVYTAHLDWSVPLKGKHAFRPAWTQKTLSFSSVSGASLLGLNWDGHPLVYDPKRKWGFLDDSGSFNRLPHPSGVTGANVGDPVGKEFLKSDRLSSDVPGVRELLLEARSWAYYVAMRSRIEGVWAVKDDMGQGWIIPNLRPTGTLTRRCADPTWLVTTSPNPKVCASEMLTMISAPPGYRFVGADVDSQELKIASFLADWYDGDGWGRGEFSKSVLYGDKSKGTDPHTLTAVNIGLDGKKDRFIGKVINFLMVYLGGVNALAAKVHAETGLPLPRCTELAQKAVKVKRGKKLISGKYHGGTDSSVYNAMLAIAEGLCPPSWTDVVCSALEPLAPFSGAKLSYALRKGVCRGDYTPSRANWVIQTTGVDMRDYVVCRMAAETPWASIVITRHDEYWYMVSEERVPEFNEVFQQVHWDFWQSLANKLELGEIPKEYRYFSEVNVDTTIRKAPNSVDTPTWKCNHVGTGYVIKPTGV